MVRRNCPKETNATVANGEEQTQRLRCRDRKTRLSNLFFAVEDGKRYGIPGNARYHDFQHVLVTLDDATGLSADHDAQVIGVTLERTEVDLDGLAGCGGAWEGFHGRFAVAREQEESCQQQYRFSLQGGGSLGSKERCSLISVFLKHRGVNPGWLAPVCVIAQVC
jgi:hypothetical protein